MYKTSSILSLVTAFMMTVVLSACGSKGALYQTPDVEPVIVEQTLDAQKATKPQLKKKG